MYSVYKHGMIKLRFEKGSLATQVILKDEALASLLKLVSEHQSDELVIPAALPPAATVVVAATESSKSAKDWFLTVSAPEVLNQIKWSTNPEKVLLLGAFHEARSNEEVWRSADIENRFAEARETFPANFPRDIRTAIKDGLIAPVTPRTYRVSRTGWNKINEAIAKLQGM